MFWGERKSEISVRSRASLLFVCLFFFVSFSLLSDQPQNHPLFSWKSINLSTLSTSFSTKVEHRKEREEKKSPRKKRKKGRKKPPNNEIFREQTHSTEEHTREDLQQEEEAVPVRSWRFNEGKEGRRRSKEQMNKRPKRNKNSKRTKQKQTKKKKIFFFFFPDHGANFLADFWLVAVVLTNTSHTKSWHGEMKLLDGEDPGEHPRLVFDITVKMGEIWIKIKSFWD